MQSAKRFLFETSFDGHQATLTGAGRAGDAAGGPSTTPYGADDIAAAREEGFAAGRVEGLEAARRTHEHVMAEAVGSISRQLPVLSGAAVQADAWRTSAAIKVAVNIVRKLFPELTRRNALVEIEGLVAECLNWLREEPRIVIRVADALLDPLTQRIDALSVESGFAGRIVLLAEPEMTLGDARVEWADGGVERNAERLWRDVDDVIARLSNRTDCANDSTDNDGGRWNEGGSPTDGPEPHAPAQQGILSNQEASHDRN